MYMILTPKSQRCKGSDEWWVKFMYIETNKKQQRKLPTHTAIVFSSHISTNAFALIAILSRCKLGLTNFASISKYRNNFSHAAWYPELMTTLGRMASTSSSERPCRSAYHFLLETLVRDLYGCAKDHSLEYLFVKEHRRRYFIHTSQQACFRWANSSASSIIFTIRWLGTVP